MANDDVHKQTDTKNQFDGTHMQPLVSVIMPVYNEAEYIQTAIESVLMQKTDFPVELIIVDDCSTDETPDIVQSYIDKHPTIIRYIKNEKNSGNAYSFWNGLNQCNADFFHVLDGDDFFISPQKLQIQVDFLLSHPTCSAVATNSLRLLPDGTVHPERMPGNGHCFFTYEQVLRCEFYLHTSAYLYRNVFKNDVPEFLKEEWARGDTIRTILVAQGHKVGFIDTIASVYRFHQKGIWTSMTQVEQINRTIRVFRKIRDHALKTTADKALFSDTIRDWEDTQLSGRFMRWLKLLTTPRRIPSRLRKAMLLERTLHKLFQTSKPIGIKSLQVEKGCYAPFFSKPWQLRIPPEERKVIYDKLRLELAYKIKDGSHA